jgi:hypothetical protein
MSPTSYQTAPPRISIIINEFPIVKRCSVDVFKVFPAPQKHHIQPSFPSIEKPMPDQNSVGNFEM